MALYTQVLTRGCHLVLADILVVLSPLSPILLRHVPPTALGYILFLYQMLYCLFLP